ncbi:MAG: DUF1993 domain-containing protein [Phenylobacterium sp.]|uniref:DUF1993 domain-containing protein n=1 Tax=Phenylobacterium sp. TaxID=1871053 RepID=UPI00391C3F2B
MAASLFTFVDLFSRQAGTASHLLDKGVEFAALNGVSEREMLGWRLIEDMAPLSFQIMVVANFTRLWPARVAGLPPPAEVGDDLDVAGYQAVLADARAFLAGLTPEQFAGRDEVPLTFQIGPGMEPTLPAAQWLTVFATTNLYFHLSTAYGILRSKGAPIGKVDLFATGL